MPVSGAVRVASMRRNLDRLISLIRRFRVDGRLPPPVSALVRDVIRLRSRDRFERFSATVHARWSRHGAHDVVRCGGRWLVTSGALDVPFDELRHRFAREVLDRLDTAGIEAFAVDRRDQHLVFGLELGDRPHALGAITGGETEGWYLEYDAGASTRRRLVGPGGELSRCAVSTIVADLPSVVVGRSCGRRRSSGRVDVLGAGLVGPTGDGRHPWP